MEMEEANPFADCNSSSEPGPLTESSDAERLSSNSDPDSLDSVKSQEEAHCRSFPPEGASEPWKHMHLEVMVYQEPVCHTSKRIVRPLCQRKNPSSLYLT